MKKTEIMNVLSRNINKVGFQVKKHSPEILLATGILTGIAGAVMACKATTKLSQVKENAQIKLDDIHEYVEEKGYSEEYTEQDHKKNLAKVYTQTGIELIKLYGPSVALGMLAVTSILASNDVLRKRNVALAAAYATIDQGFKDYRGRVIERFGQEMDRELKYNIKAQEIEETVVDGKGKEKTVKKTVQVANPTLYSDYAKYFDSSSLEWENNAEYNLMFLKAQQQYANDLLKSRGRLFLNEVYDMLGIERTKAGQMVGWVYDRENPSGDNFVDFGIYELYREANRDFVNGLEPVILLDFNVDGNVWELM